MNKGSVQKGKEVKEDGKEKEGNLGFQGHNHTEY